MRSKRLLVRLGSLFSFNFELTKYQVDSDWYSTQATAPEIKLLDPNYAVELDA
jgi:hypothetical protein